MDNTKGPLTNSPLRISSKKPTDMKGAQAEFERLITQARSLSDSLINEDHFTDLHPHVLSSLLWLLDDRLADIEHSVQHIINFADNGGVKHE